MRAPADALAAHFGTHHPQHIGLAVSGGSDSLALMHIAADWAAAQDVKLTVFTIDHGLRAEAAAEIALVANAAQSRDLSHVVLTWTGWDGQGNLQDRARAARYHLISTAARAQGILDVVLAHTADDQAETVLMRLARGAGVDGLSAMHPRRFAHDVRWHRPLLDVSRDALREDLQERGQVWADDPTNDDPKYARIAMRQARPTLEALGLTAAALGHTAKNMAEVRAALDWQTERVAQDVACESYAAICIATDRLRIYPSEIIRRLILRALAWVGRASYPPRRAGMQGFVEAVLSGETATLDGCQTVSAGGRAWIFRELHRVQGHKAPLHEVWDGCWRCDPPNESHTKSHLSALGPIGLAQVADWRDHGVPRDVLLALPAVFEGDTLLAAPPISPANGWYIARQDAADSVFPKRDTH